MFEYCFPTIFGGNKLTSKTTCFKLCLFLLQDSANDLLVDDDYVASLVLFVMSYLQENCRVSHNF